MKGRRWVLTAALAIAGIRLWTQLRGDAKTPFGEWAIGWGVTFFAISLLSEVYPQAAAGLAGTVVVGDFLVNGQSLFKDITSAISTGANFQDTPFAATAAPAGKGSSGPSAQQVNTATGATSGRGAAQSGPASAQQTNTATGAR